MLSQVYCDMSAKGNTKTEKKVAVGKIGLPIHYKQSMKSQNQLQKDATEGESFQLP